MHNARIAQRWVVFECIPWAYTLDNVRLHIMEEREDPLHWWAQDYLKRTGAVPTPFWVCQGNPMGHPYKYNAIERGQAKAGELPPDPPALGSLAYSEPSDLTWEAIRRRSNLNRRIVSAEAHRLDQQQKAERHARFKMIDGLIEQLTPIMKENASEIMNEHARPVERGVQSKANLDDEHFARYIETGHLELTPT